MNKSAVAILAVCGVAIAAAGGYWIGTQRIGTPVAAPSATASAPSKGAAPVTVEATKAVFMRLPQTITAVGSLRSDESITLRPEVAGRISSIHFLEGERVARGAALVKLDPSVTEAEERQARANLTWAKQKYQRAIDLQKQGFISGQAK